MFKTQLFNKKAIAKKNPRIINVIDFMTARTNVPLKTMTDLREHVCELVTDYYQECYARALIENGGREPKLMLTKPPMLIESLSRTESLIKKLNN